MDELIIQTTNLTKSYGPHVALDNLNLAVKKGATGLLGPNGAGKSTFLKTILGLMRLCMLVKIDLKSLDRLEGQQT